MSDAERLAQLTDIVQRCIGFQEGSPYHDTLKWAAAELTRLSSEVAALRKALEAIKRATVEGRVCDDVAWFDEITTLYEFCDAALAATACDEVK